MRFVLAPPVPVLLQRERVRFPSLRGNIPPPGGLLPLFGRRPRAYSDSDLELAILYGSYRLPINNLIVNRKGYAETPRQSNPAAHTAADQTVVPVRQFIFGSVATIPAEIIQSQGELIRDALSDRGWSTNSHSSAA